MYIKPRHKNKFFHQLFNSSLYQQRLNHPDSTPHQTFSSWVPLWVVTNGFLLYIVTHMNTYSSWVVSFLTTILLLSLYYTYRHVHTTIFTQTVITIFLINSGVLSVILLDHFFTFESGLSESFIKLTTAIIRVIFPGSLLLWVVRNKEKLSSIIDTHLPQGIKKTPSHRYLVALSLIVFSIVAVPRLFFYIQGDEFLQFNTAVGFLKTGQLWQWDFINQKLLLPYDRSWPTTLLFAVSMKLFGISEFAARLPSFISAIGVLFLIYFVTKTLIQKTNVAALVTYFFATNTWFIWYSTNVRMYIFFIATSLLFFVSLYFTYSFERKRISFLWTSAALLSLLASIIIHRAALSLLPLTLLYVCYIGYFHFKNEFVKKKKLIATFFIFYCLLGIIIVPQLYRAITYYYRGYLNPSPSFEFNPISIHTFFTFPFVTIMTIVIATWVIYFLVKKDSFPPRVLFLSFFTIGSHVLYILLAQEHHARYAAHIVPFTIILMIYTLYVLLRTKFSLEFTISVLFITITLFNTRFAVSQVIANGAINYENPYNYDFMYDPNYEQAQWENYKIAQEKIRSVYTPGMLIIGDNIPIRSYYFQDAFTQPFRYHHIPDQSIYRDSDVEGATLYDTQEDLEKLVAENPHGMFIWVTRKEQSLTKDPDGREVVNYIVHNFKKISGMGVDTSFIEIYQW